MSNLNKFYLSHIGRVSVAYVISAKNLVPLILTKITGVEPESSAKLGDNLIDYKGRPLPRFHEQGFWRISSEGKIVSKDINEHFNFVLEQILPHKEKILSLIDELNGDAGFDILWESSYLYAGTGPVFSAETLCGIGKMNASMGFDIYQIKENKAKKQK